jgi:hypothetical protein
VYREVFPNDFISPTVTGAQGLEATAQGWYAAQHGGTPFVTSSGQIAKPASGNGEPGAVGSNPQGSTTDTGFFFWSPSQRAGIFMYTGEVAALNLSTSSLTEVRWDSRNSSDNSASSTNMRLAFLVGGQWFISSAGEPHSNGSGNTATWETNSLAPLSLTYQLFNDNNTNETPGSLPRNNDNLPAVQALPDGVIQAAGLWMSFNTAAPNVNPTIRIDNFEISANTVPIPGSLPLIGLGLVGLMAARRSKPKQQMV